VSEAEQSRAAFYCVADERYFLGAVGMINSLRLQGHDEPIFLLDRGLRPDQRDLISSAVTLVPARTEIPGWLMKTVAPLANPATVMVLIDADMIVTRSMADLIAAASDGRVVAFEAGYERFVPDWGDLLSLGPIRRGPYLSSALVVLGGPVGQEVLRVMAGRQPVVRRMIASGPERDRSPYAFMALDQDVLNAVLAARVEPERVVVLPHRLAPDLPFEGLRLASGPRPRCAYRDGTEPYVVHHLVVTRLPTLERSGDKPWLGRVPSSLYSRLLTRCLLGPGLAVTVPEREVPLRLRDGFVARAARTPVDARARLGWYLRKRLPTAVVARVDASRRRRAGQAS
jgi:hypothetical protein